MQHLNFTGNLKWFLKFGKSVETELSFEHLQVHLIMNIIRWINLIMSENILLKRVRGPAWGDALFTYKFVELLNTQSIEEYSIKWNSRSSLGQRPESRTQRRAGNSNGHLFFGDPTRNTGTTSLNSKRRYEWNGCESRAIYWMTNAIGPMVINHTISNWPNWPTDKLLYEIAMENSERKQIKLTSWRADCAVPQSNASYCCRSSSVLAIRDKRKIQERYRRDNRG